MTVRLESGLVLDESRSAEIKRKLHEFIHNSDLSGLKTYVDTMQRSLLSFDDPSLLMMAIEVYLDPKCLTNEEFQLEIVTFLSKCGLKFYIPGGSFFMYVFEYCRSKEDETNDEKEFEVKLVTLFDHLLGYENRTDLLQNAVPEVTYYQQVTSYLTRHKAAVKIQSWWRGYWCRKNLKN